VHDPEQSANQSSYLHPGPHTPMLKLIQTLPFSPHGTAVTLLTVPSAQISAKTIAHLSQIFDFT
jgi:hypothetical protein